MLKVLSLPYIAGADPGFQVRGTHIKELRRAEGGAKFFEVFRVKNHIFSNFRGGAPVGAPTLDPPLYSNYILNNLRKNMFFSDCKATDRSHGAFFH